MGDPLQGYTPNWRDQQEEDPLAGYDPDWRSKIKGDARFETAMGRRTIEAETNQKQLAAFREYVKTATGARKARLEKSIQELERELSPFSTAGSLKGSVDRFIGGVKGAVPQLGMGLLDLGLAGVELAGKGVNKAGIPTPGWATKGREILAEGMVGMDEMTGAEGIEGIGGSFVGAIGAGALGAGTRAVATSEAVGRLASSSSAIARGAAHGIKIINKGVELANLPGAAYGQVSNATLRFLGKSALLRPAARAGLQGGRAARIAGSMIGDLPTNVFQAMTIPGANPYDIARSIAIGTAGSAVGGALSSRIPFDVPKDVPFSADLSSPVTGESDPVAVKLAAEVQRMADWAAAHPDKSWSDLSPIEQATIQGAENPLTLELQGHATRLKNYIVGAHEDVDAAQQSFLELATNPAMTPELLTSMMGLKTSIVDGKLIMVGSDGVVPDPDRMLVASGEAPRATRAAAKAQSNSTLNQRAVDEQLNLETPTIEIFGRIKEEGLGDLVKAEAAKNRGKSEPHIVAEAAARNILTLYDSFRIGRKSPEQAIEAIQKILDLPAKEAKKIIKEINKSATRMATEGVKLDALTPDVSAPSEAPTETPIAGVSRPITDVSRTPPEVDTPPEPEAVIIDRTPVIEPDQGFYGDDPTGKAQQYTWTMEDGSTVTVVGHVEDGTFNIKMVDSSDGPGSIGTKMMREIQRQLSDITGAKKFTGTRVSGSNEDRGTVTTEVRAEPEAPFDVDAAKAEWNDIQDKFDDGTATEAELAHAQELFARIEEEGGWNADAYVEEAPAPVPEPIVAEDVPPAPVVKLPANVVEAINAEFPKMAEAEPNHWGLVKMKVELGNELFSAKWAKDRRALEVHYETSKGAYADKVFRIESDDPFNPEVARQHILDAFAEIVPLASPTGTRAGSPAPTPARGTTGTAPRTTTETAPAAAARTAGELSTIVVGKPLRNHSIKQLEKMMDRVYAPYDADPKKMQLPEYKLAQQDALTIRNVIKELEAQGPESEYVRERPVDDNKLATLFAKEFKKMTEDELTQLNLELTAKIPATPDGPAKDLLVEKMLDLRAYQQEKFNADERTAQKKAEASARILEKAGLEPKPGKAIPPGDPRAGYIDPKLLGTIVSANAGFVIGYATADEDADAQEKIRRGLLGGLLLGGGVAGAFMLKGRIAAANYKKVAKVPGEEALSKVMQSNADKTPGTPNEKLLITMGKFERFYQKTLRPSRFGERLARVLAGGAEMGKQVGEMLATFGLHHHSTSEWMFQGPMKQDASGTWVPVTTIRADGTVVPVPSVASILQSVDSDIDMLGKTAMALSAIEHFKRTGKTPHPDLDVGSLSQFVSHVDKKFIQAAMQMRDVHLGLLDLQVQAGIITQDARAAMANERFYTALERVFGSTQGGIAKDIGSKIKNFINAPEPVKSREGPNDWDIRNPVETLMYNLPRVMKAVELQQKKAALINLYDASNLPKELKNSYLQPVAISQKERLGMAGEQAKIESLRQYLPDIDDATAKNLIATYDAAPLGPNSDFMVYIRQGKREVWRLHSDLVDTFRYMQGYEIARVWQFLGATSDVARFGVGFSPDFIARMAWFDVFQTYMNSKYGDSFRDLMPGVNWADAFYKLWTKDASLRQFKGGTAEGSMFEGLRTPEEIVRRAQAQGDTYTADIWKAVKGGDLPTAYKTLIVPFAEAGRASEYAADLRHGKSVQEAIRSSTGVTGYYNQVGQYTAALFRMIPFLKGTTQSLDQAFAASGLHPFREYDTANRFTIPLPGGKKIQWGDTRRAQMWITKGIIAIALPTAGIYAANYGDEEIAELRKTDQGRRFFFFRLPTGGIMSVRKPAGPESQLFSTGLEAMLDSWQGEDPAAFREWVGAMRREFSIPYLPPVVSAVGAMVTGQDLSFNSPLVTDAASRLPIDMQRRTNTSELATDISSSIVNTLGEPKWDWLRRTISPAGIDHIVRTIGGTLAMESFKGVDLARAAATNQALPAKEELPILRKFLSIDMTKQQTRTMEDFYEMVGEAERITNGLNRTLRDGDVEGYIAIMQRKGTAVHSAKLLLDTRKEVTEFTRAIEELKNYNGDPDYKRKMIIQLRKSMNLMMANAVGAAQAIQD